MKIIKINNGDEKFYQLIGKFLANRQVEKEIGYKIYDDDLKDWFFAVKNEELCGFCYRWKKPNHFQIGSCYVVESERNKGLMKKLINSVVGQTEGIIKITCKETMMDLLLLEGFKKTKSTGKFIECVKI